MHIFLKVYQLRLEDLFYSTIKDATPDGQNKHLYDFTSFFKTVNMMNFMKWEPNQYKQFLMNPLGSDDENVHGSLRKYI